MRDNLDVFRRLIALVIPFWKWIVLSVLLGLLTVGSSIGLLAASAWIISKAALQPSIAVLQMAIVGVRFFGISRGIFRYLERLVSHEVTFRLLAQLRVWFYREVEPLAPARLMQYRSGDLLGRIVGDVETLEDFYVRVIAPPLVALLVTVLMSILMGLYDWSLVATLLIFILAAGTGVPALTWMLSRSAGRDLMVARANLNAALLDTIQGMSDIVAFNQETLQLESLSRLNRAVESDQTRIKQANALQLALGSLLVSLAAIAILTAAIPMVDGVVLATLVLATVACFEAVSPLPTAFQYLGGNLETARRLFEIVDAEPIVQDSEASSAAPQGYSLVVQNLCFRYDGAGPYVLDDISFTLPEGSQMAVVGPSGAGKSTLVNLLLRFWDYQEGQVLLGGKELRTYNQEDVRRMIGVVTQSTYLFNTTIRENLLLARRDASEDALIEASRQAQIRDFIVSLPGGYDTYVGELGLNLSGGERQRLAIARVFLKDAPILILDEATANLDALNERKVMKAAQKLMEGRTTLIITHRLVGLETADEILVLRSGRVVERGQHQELIEKGGVYSQMRAQTHISS